MRSFRQAIDHARRSGALDKYPKGGADVLAFGFGITVAMWVTGYIGRMPAVQSPAPLLASGLLIVLLAGGFLVGRLTDRGALGGAAVGLIVGGLNLFVIAGTLGGAEVSGPAAVLWVPGTLLATAAVTALAAAIGRRFHREPAHRPPTTTFGGRPPAKTSGGRPNWTARFAAVAAIATGLLLVVGGLVTGREAGLAVRGWPDSFGYNMFLYPLARMAGNIYYEHTHRLYGALIGLTTLVLTLHLWRNDDRRWLKVLALVAVIAVIAQGVMGGMRVALAQEGGGFEVARAEHETAASLALRVAHGVFAQMFFGLMVAIAAFTTTAWRDPRTVITRHPAASTDRTLALLLLILLLTQLLLGALVRHTGGQQYVLLHITAAALLTFLAMAAGMRAWGIYDKQQPLLRQLGLLLMILVGVQLALGVGALVATGLWAAADAPPSAEVLITTAHQANGAALLAIAVLLAAFNWRLLVPAEPRPAERHRPASAAAAGPRD